MYNKKYCNTLCCNSIRRVVEYILLTPSPIGQSPGRVWDLHPHRMKPMWRPKIGMCIMYMSGCFVEIYGRHVRPNISTTRRGSSLVHIHWSGCGCRRHQWCHHESGVHCEGDTETRPLVYRDSLRQEEPNRCDTLTQW